MAVLYTCIRTIRTIENRVRYPHGHVHGMSSTWQGVSIHEILCLCQRKRPTVRSIRWSFYTGMTFIDLASFDNTTRIWGSLVATIASLPVSERRYQNSNSFPKL